MRFANRIPTTKIKILMGTIIYSVISPFFPNKQFQIKRGGINYQIDLTEGIDLMLFFFGNFQNHITHNRFYTLAKDATVFDIGANSGVMSLQFAKIASNGKIYAFEPTHFAFKRLQENLKLNPILSKKIVPIQTFISNKNNKNPNLIAYASWKVGNKDKKTHPIHLGTAKPASGVSSLTIDAFCKSQKINKLDFIKIDTDGHEYSVLIGGRQTIKRLKPVILFEVGDYLLKEHNIKFQSFLDFFGKNNYRLFNTQSGIEITSKNRNLEIPELGTIDIIALPQSKIR